MIPLSDQTTLEVEAAIYFPFFVFNSSRVLTVGINFLRAISFGQILPKMSTLEEWQNSHVNCRFDLISLTWYKISSNSMQ